MTLEIAPAAGGCDTVDMVIRNSPFEWSGGGAVTSSALAASDLSWLRLIGLGEPFLGLIHRHAGGAVPVVRGDDGFSGASSDPVRPVAEPERIPPAQPVECQTLALRHPAKPVLANLVSHAVNYTVNGAVSQASSQISCGLEASVVCKARVKRLYCRQWKSELPSVSRPLSRPLGF
jgi:hypothetical protein